MHLANQKFWEYVYDTYHDYLTELIYEFGSNDAIGMGENDPVLRASRDAISHIGIDWRPGINVDIVSLAHEVKLPLKANAILSASMLEHDPYAELSLAKMVDSLKGDGLIALSWGSARNNPHYFEHSPVGQHHPLKAGIVINLLERSGVNIVEFLYEGYRYPNEVDPNITGGMGDVCLVGIKGEIPDKYEILIDELLPEDEE
jgi:hypothetical protein